jgi:hypothetical protein
MHSYVINVKLFSLGVAIMPKALIIPDPDMMLGEHDGAQLYFRDANNEQPLYRDCKIIRRTKPLFAKRRAAYLHWIIHEQRFARGGDAYRLELAQPEMFKWAGECMGKEFDQAYLADSFGLTAPEIDALIAAERAKYAKAKQ